MATLYISEYGDLARDASGNIISIGVEPAQTTQTRSISGTSAQSNAFASGTRYVRIHTDAICSILFGANPTATTSHARLAADSTEYFCVTAGHKVAAITNT